MEKFLKILARIYNMIEIFAEIIIILGLFFVPFMAIKVLIDDNKESKR